MVQAEQSGIGCLMMAPELLDKAMDTVAANRK